MKKLTAISLSIFFLTACKKENTAQTKFVPELDKDTIEKYEANKKATIDDEYHFLDAIETKKLPFADSTNFDNFKKKNKLTEQQIKLLKLDLVTDSETKEGEAVKTLKPTYINL
jgi:nucleoside-specific outer membrane channel protein Tsx